MNPAHGPAPSRPQKNLLTGRGRCIITRLIARVYIADKAYYVEWIRKAKGFLTRGNPRKHKEMGRYLTA